ncbi:LANO_0F10748g1_1 [Lachancea nothofagi CBS 11611]|uniref:E3 ubiquitin-protein ligase PEP5 n=1 Tax=Lachancea nothofagi CBS 11611 TaxID=1266666 RepID=A0A1G4KAM6_9SACH|nr:LANO_0F10748g1_1 [Lachancea nothofagi CBS 11611]
MSFRSWRQFQFFENVPLRDPQIGSPTPLFSDPTLSAACPLQNGKLFIAVQSRVLRLVNLKTLEVELEFEAYPEGFQVTYLCAIEDTYVVSVAEQVGKPCSLKVWRIDKRPSNEFDFHSAIEVKNGKNTFPLSAISISKDLTCMAIGFVNGRIVLIRGDIVHDRGSKQRIIYEDPNKEPITALMFDSENRTCFASTTSALHLFDTYGRNSGKPGLTLKTESGVDLNCSCVSSDGKEFICCFNNSIDFYKPSGEKRSLVTDLTTIKRVYAIDKDHLLILSGVQASNNTVLHVSNTASPSNRLVILDIRNKLIAMNTLISGNVLDIFASNLTGEPSVVLLTSDGTMHQINEKSITEKVQIVEQKELYQIALDLAEQSQLSPLRIEEIRKKYAEYLYNNGDKTDAIEQYLQCLNVTETSEVIAKFGVENSSSSEDVSILSFYLLSMMQKGMSNSDHVTLYIISLIKLKNEEGIHSFIRHFSRSGEYLEQEESEQSWMDDDESFFYSDATLFDLDLTLRLMLESGFALLSYKLARKFSKSPEMVVDILIDDLNDPHSALRYTKSLPVDDALRMLISFSKKLLELLPNDTNALLIELFTGKYQQIRFEDVSGSNSLHGEKTDHDVFYSYKSFVDFMKSTSNIKNSEPDAGTPTYHPPRPALIFTSFINQRFEFVVFLEACLGSYNEFSGFDHDKQLILTTLYDVYLSLAKDDEKSRQNEWREKARLVYQDSIKLVKASSSTNSTLSGERSNKPVDNSLMMLISQVNDIDLSQDENEIDVESKTFKYDKADLIYKFESLSLTSDPLVVLKFIEQYGLQEPALYSMGLAHFISSKSVMKEIGGEPVFREKILQRVLDLDLMPLLDILQVLGSTNVATFGLVQEILIEHIKSESQEIRNNKKLIESYKAELTEKDNKLNSLIDENNPLQIKLKSQNCNTCHLQISPPVVFFKCNHIYHQRCLNEEEYLGKDGKFFQCPQCIVDYETTEGMKQAQVEAQKNASLLRMALNDKENSKDRFRVVTEFIGRGGLDSC